MKKILITLMVAMMVTGVAAQDEQTTNDTEDELDVGLFAADHPLHNLELVVDNVGNSAGLIDAESIAEKRANEAVDLSERDAGGIEEALDRLDQASEALEEVDNGTEAVASVTDKINQIADQQPDFEDRASQSVDSLPDRSGENISADFVTNADADGISVSGEVETPTTGYSIENTNFTNDQGLEYRIEVVEAGDDRFVGQAFQTHEFEDSIDLDQGTHDLDLVVENNGEDVVTDSVELEVE